MSGLLAGGKATLKPEKTPWSSPRVWPEARIPAVWRSWRMCEASWGLPLLGKVAL